MSNYIDGFVLPIPNDKLENYRLLVEQVAQIWKEYGALDYREFVGDDLSLEGVRSFTELHNTDKDQTVIFGWVIFSSKQERDLINKKVASDPRMLKLVQQFDTGFDAQKMFYGGFKPLVLKRYSPVEILRKTNRNKYHSYLPYMATNLFNSSLIFSTNNS